MENWDAALLGIGHLVWFGVVWSGYGTVRCGRAGGESWERVGRELAVSKNGQEWANDRNGGGWGFSSLTLQHTSHTSHSPLVPPGVALFSLFSSLASCSLLACCCSCSSPSSSSSYHHIISIS